MSVDYDSLAIVGFVTALSTLPWKLAKETVHFYLEGLPRRAFGWCLVFVHVFEK
jgi:hypothetical protein